jgi:Fur family peroxide stress response transcriptional regulator
MTELHTSLEALDSTARFRQIVNKLEEAGHRITPQRLCIIEVLLASKKHPSAEEIFAHVRAISPTTSLATIYKTMDTLKSLGEVLELETRDNRVHFDGLRPIPHPHIICTNCGLIEDIDLPGASELNREAEHASGFDVDEHRLEFFGLCINCKSDTPQHVIQSRS